MGRAIKSPKNLITTLILIGFTGSILLYGLSNEPPQNKIAIIPDKIVNSYDDPESEIIGNHENPTRVSSPRELCACQKHDSLVQSGSNDGLRDGPQSTCSYEATLAGPDQTVISFSFYEGPPDPYNRSYFNGIQRQLNGIREFYPGSVMRLYSDISLTQNRNSLKLCHLICENQDLLYYCPIQQIQQFGNLSRIQQMIWRFLPLGDATVKEFHVRDLDSRITQREADAVVVWRLSNFPWHGMRDHPMHCAPIVGGAWGGNNERIGLSRARKIMKKIVVTGRNRFGWGVDQQAIAEHIHKPYGTKLLVHDAYCCAKFNESVPFPTKRRLENHHVVQVHFDGKHESPVAICPEECRPTYGKDWERC